jgi:hypothetical protein
MSIWESAGGELRPPLRCLGGESVGTSLTSRPPDCLRQCLGMSAERLISDQDYPQ